MSGTLDAAIARRNAALEASSAASVAASYAAEQAAFATFQSGQMAIAEAALVKMGYTEAQLEGFFGIQATSEQAALKMTSGGYAQVIFSSQYGNQRAVASNLQELLLVVAQLISQSVTVVSVGPLA